MAFSSYYFKILPTFYHGIFSDWESIFLFFHYYYFLEISRNYIMPIMSIILIIVSNITVLVSQKIISFGFLCLWAMVSTKRLVQVPPPTSLYPTRFSPGLFVVLQEMLDQSSISVIRLFAKDNAFSKKIRFFPLSHCWSILLFCFYVF